MIAIVRTDSWDLPLFLHVLGAATLVSLLAVAVVVLVVSLRTADRQPALRFAFRVLWMGAIPAYVVMRVGAEWIADKEDLADSDLSWIGIGYSVADGGLLILLIVTLLTGLAARRAKQSGELRSGLVRAATALTALVIVGYAVALWAMAAKPT
jgi:hypothetical protein